MANQQIILIETRTTMNEETRIRFIESVEEYGGWRDKPRSNKPSIWNICNKSTRLTRFLAKVMNCAFWNAANGTDRFWLSNANAIRCNLTHLYKLCQNYKCYFNFHVMVCLCHLMYEYGERMPHSWSAMVVVLIFLMLSKIYVNVKCYTNNSTIYSTTCNEYRIIAKNDEHSQENGTTNATKREEKKHFWNWHEIYVNHVYFAWI